MNRCRLFIVNIACTVFKIKAIAYLGNGLNHINEVKVQTFHS